MKMKFILTPDVNPVCVSMKGVTVKLEPSDALTAPVRITLRMESMAPRIQEPEHAAAEALAPASRPLKPPTITLSQRGYGRDALIDALTADLPTAEEDEEACHGQYDRSALHAEIQKLMETHHISEEEAVAMLFEEDTLAMLFEEDDTDNL